MADQTPGIAGAPPSWDDTTPFEASQTPKAPKIAAQPAANAATAAPAPETSAPAPTATPAEPAPDAPPTWDETTDAPAPAAPEGPTHDPLPMGTTIQALKDYVEHNVRVHAAIDQGKNPLQATTMIDALQAGLQMSTAGLGLRQQMPDMVLPEHSGMALRIANQIGTLAGDMPAMAAGFTGGAAAGAAVTGPAAPAGAAVGGSMGAFAFPAALRKVMIDSYQKGEVHSASDFWERAAATTWEGTKGALTGLATAVAGPVAGSFGAKAGALVGPVAESIAGPAAKFMGDVGAMTTVGAGLEGHLPHAQDFIDGAIVIGGLHAATSIAPKIQEIYAKTGENPAVVAGAAQNDVILKQQLLVEDPTSPPQAHPTDLVYPDKEEWDPPEPKEGEVKETLSPEEKQQAAQPRLEPISQEIPDPPAPVVPERSPEVQEVLSKIGVAPETPSATVRETFDKFYAANVDYLDPLNAALADAKKNGVEVPSEKNAYEMGRLFAAHTDRVRAFLEDGTRDGVTGEINGEGLNKIYKDLPPGADGKPDLDGYRAFAMAKRAQELDSRGITPWEDFSAKNAQKVIEEGQDKFEAIHRRQVDFGNRVLDYAMKKGLFSQDQLARMKEMNEQHIPFYRVMDPDTWSGKTPGGTAVKRIYGSDRAILDPVLSTFKNVEAIIKKADINAVRNAFVESMTKAGMIEIEGAENKPETSYLRRVENKLTAVEISPGEITNEIRKQRTGTTYSAFAEQYKENNPEAKQAQIRDAWKEESGVGDLEKGLNVFRHFAEPLRDNQVAAYVDGKRQIYEGAPGVIDSLRRLDGNAQMMGMWGKVLEGFTKATRIGVTSDPGFGFRHFFRSQIMSGVYSQTGQIPFIHSALAMGEFMKGESETYKNWLYDGGAVSSWDRMNDDYLKTNVEQANEKAPFHEKAWNVVTKPLHASEAWIKATDNLSRFVEYKRTLEQGGSRAEAAFAAREVTVDYQKQGLQRSVMRAGVAFIGAHINSLDRMGQAFKEDPKGTTAKLAVLSAISAGVWALNKDDEAIQALPNWQKDLYWNFRVANTGPDGQAMIMRLPKPWSAGIVFGSGVETALDMWKGTSPSRADDFAHSILSSVVPEPIPNAIGPVLEQWANKSLFSGRPLIYEDKEKLVPELQYEPYTSQTARGIAKLIGYVPYVRDIGPSNDKLASPAVVENYVHGWTGTLGGWALRLGDEGLNRTGLADKFGIGTKASRDADTMEDSPFFRQFVSRYPSVKDQPIQDFYDNYDKTSRVLNSIRYANKKGDVETALRIQQSTPELQIRLDGIHSGVSAARKSLQQVKDLPDVRPVEKRQLMDTILFQMHSMAKMGNQLMKDFERNVTRPDVAETGGK